MRLGERLLRAGAITEQHLEQALKAQVVHGGRIGTNLIEIAKLNLDVVAEQLATLHNMPAALQKHFENSNPEVQKLLSPELADKFKMIPIGKVTGATPPRLAVAVMDPVPPDMKSEVERILGYKIMPAIAAELRIHYHLESVYGIRRPNRFKRVQTQADDFDDETTDVQERGERRRFVETISDPARAESPQVLAKLDLRKSSPKVKKKSGLTGERNVEIDYTNTDDVVKAMRRATGRDRVGELVVGAMHTGFDRVIDTGMVLVVRETVAVGWKGFVRDQADSAAIEMIAIPLEHPSAIRESYRRNAAYFGGPMKNSPIEARLFSVLSVPPPKHMIVVPVELLGEVICLLYAHGDTIQRDQADTIANLGRTMGAVFERLTKAAQR